MARINLWGVFLGLLALNQGLISKLKNLYHYSIALTSSTYFVKKLKHNRWNRGKGYYTATGPVVVATGLKPVAGPQKTTNIGLHGSSPGPSAGANVREVWCKCEHSLLRGVYCSFVIKAGRSSVYGIFRKVEVTGHEVHLANIVSLPFCFYLLPKGGVFTHVIRESAAARPGISIFILAEAVLATPAELPGQCLSGLGVRWLDLEAGHQRASQWFEVALLLASGGVHRDQKKDRNGGGGGGDLGLTWSGQSAVDYVFIFEGY
ncbi:hypothetical protein DEU56DRAFT_762308 [Suillus clintonianus]|uniref:uncharacterized protein n=1 Tax=Suillus clintonianus TaxID=1904413 RepID=UPI001B87B321|nr:uncharacterized protein DEU56DRAFT_762308 [Suillus clintonianus]KAG2110493.1 hypothetical protein DEU56DRAFT_762308 [Suillus clintonianus]